MPPPKPTFYEFFAGGGMARAGLGSGWECLFSNDFDRKKAGAYAANWGAERFCVGDIAAINAVDLPAQASLAWASFPCQDLSLAGNQAGLKGARSGTFWAFMGLMAELAAEGRAPKLIVLENVCGALTSHEGKDFAAIGEALADAGYHYGAVVIDAVLFVPQSRPRLFVIAARKDRRIDQRLTASGPSDLWHPANLLTAQSGLPVRAKAAWIWWNLPRIRPRRSKLADLIEDDPRGVAWHTDAETRRLLSLMSELNKSKVEHAKQSGRRVVGAIYRRTRSDGNGGKRQRAEVRFDGVAGCLRTPAGGSSRQTIIVVEGERVRTRLLAAREAARLMGLAESYQLPANYNEAYHLAGDGVVAPVVSYLARNLLEPLLA